MECDGLDIALFLGVTVVAFLHIRKQSCVKTAALHKKCYFPAKCFLASAIIISALSLSACLLVSR